MSQIKLNGRKHVLKLSNLKAKNIAEAKLYKIPIDLRLSEQEIRASGLRDWFKKVGEKLKQGSQYYQKNLKSVIGPILRGIAEKGLDAAETAAVVFNPALAPVVTAVKSRNQDIVDKLGKVTGAYGLIKVKLNKRQLYHLINGKTVQLKRGHLDPPSDGVDIDVSSLMHKKYLTAMKNNRGMRLKVNILSGEGAGLREMYRTAKPHARKGVEIARDIFARTVRNNLTPKIENLIEKKTQEGFAKLKKRFPQIPQEDLDSIQGLMSRELVAQSRKIGLTSPGGKGLEVSELPVADATIKTPVGRGRPRGMPRGGAVIYQSQLGQDAKPKMPVGI